MVDAEKGRRLLMQLRCNMVDDRQMCRMLYVYAIRMHVHRGH